MSVDSEPGLDATSLLNLLDDSALLLDRAGCLVQANTAAISRLGEARCRTGAPLDALLPADIAAACRKVLESGGEWVGVLTSAEGAGRIRAVPCRTGLLVLVREGGAPELADRDRLCTVLDLVPVGVTIAEAPSGRLLHRNARAAELMAGVVPAADAQGDARDPDAQGPEAGDPIAEVLRGGEPVGRREVLHRREDGTPVWLALSAAPVAGPPGEPTWIVATCEDVSDQKRAEERVRLISDELRHRVKNALASIQSIASLSFRTSADPQAALTAFQGRLNVLASTQDLLGGRDRATADLRAVAATTLASYGTAVRSEGPEVRLTSGRTQTLALALHELATNALQHGALSASSGSVRLLWDIRDGDQGQWVHVEWREAGGPAVPAPGRRGFGRMLIERVAARDLGGTAEMSFEETGVVARFTFPLTVAKP